MSAPEPLVPTHVDLRDLPGFMLNAERLLASELWALTKVAPDAFRGATALWARAWHQVPAASLPNNDAVLAAFADMPAARFKKLRDVVTRGFVLCSDGRLYHKHLATEALTAWERKVAYTKRRAADKQRLDEWRANKSAKRDETLTETDLKRVSRSDETASTQTQTGTRTVLEQEPLASLADAPKEIDLEFTEGEKFLDRRESPPKPVETSEPAPKRQQRKSPLPERFPDVDAIMRAIKFFNENNRPDLAHDVRTQAENFRAYHESQATLSANWAASWRTWIGRALEFSKGKSNGNKLSAHDKFLAGGAAFIAKLEQRESEGDCGDAGETSPKLLQG